MRSRRDSNRCNLAYSRLHDLVTKASSKSHDAFTRPLGSHFTGTSTTRPDGLPRLTVHPRAFNVSGALPATLMPVAETTSRGEHQLPTMPTWLKLTPVPVAGLEPARPTGHPLLRRARLPIPPHWQKRGAETNTSNNHATTARPTSGTHAHQPHHRPAQPACADTLNRPTQTGPTYSPTPRAPWRKRPSATRTHPAHHQCRHTPPA